ncbi:MAG: LamB/YcsF family protein [Selenomonas sp.]|nr:LamB/YcsF family protein [Selenomonas sp.]
MVIDLNSNLGESFGAYTLGHDEEILQVVSSANIDCGFHAGDPLVMQRTVALARQHGVAVGAHPGLPDLVSFGRRKMAVSPEEAYSIVLYQVGALGAFVSAQGLKLHHVKPHGALYNMAAKDMVLSDAIAAAVYDADKNLILYGLAGSELIKAGKAKGLKTASEVFADRSYQEDGSLTPRSQPGALLEDEEEAVAQALAMAGEGQARTASGKLIPVKADTICVHGDGAKALAFAKRIRAALETSGIKVGSCP